MNFTLAYLFMRLILCIVNSFFCNCLAKTLVLVHENNSSIFVLNYVNIDYYLFVFFFASNY